MRTGPRRTRVKFCGVTDPADANLACELGVDAVGMVLHADARRKVDAATARRIVDALPPYVTPVGLFVDAPPDLIMDTARGLRLRTVQLHGHETVDTVAALRDLDVIKVVRVEAATVVETLETWRGHVAAGRCPNLAGILLDGPSGGSGVPNDFDLLQRLQRDGRLRGLPPVVLAGGLAPQNVGTIVRTLRPYAVDVSSGIEIEYGRKDEARMRSFLDAIAIADQHDASIRHDLRSPLP